MKRYGGGGAWIERIAELIQMAKNIQSSIDKWDPDMLRSMKVKNAIKSVIIVHSDMLKDMKKQ